MPESILMKLGMYIMAPVTILTAYFINPSHQSACLYVCSRIVAGQRLGNNLTAATNTHAAIEELLAAWFFYAVRVKNIFLPLNVVSLSISHRFLFSLSSSQNFFFLHVSLPKFCTLLPEISIL
jgi:hypothetical protein